MKVVEKKTAEIYNDNKRKMEVIIRITNTYVVERGLEEKEENKRREV